MSTNSTKTIKGRISNKHGTEEYWVLSVYTDTTKTTLRENPFVPLSGELIIYDPDSIDEPFRYKFGDGVRNIVELPFVSEGLSATHSWDGTVLTITSASGTSSADLKGEKGVSGVYVGSGDMPEGYNVQIDPSGASCTTEELVSAVIAALPKYNGEVLDI